MRDLSKVTNAELEAELLRRSQADRRLANERLQKRQQLLVANVGLLLEFVPFHCRSSCSDDQHANASSNLEQYPSRCLRCQLLYIQETQDACNADLDLMLRAAQQLPVENLQVQIEVR